MIDVEYCRLLARYNRWMNERLYAAAHLFQPAVHHRGQVTTLLTQAGVDPGATDLPVLPGVLRLSLIHI